jgi:hypothetical protein
MPFIFQLPTQQPATVGIFPNIKSALFGDDLAVVTTAGYLNSVNLESNPIASTDIIQALYSYNHVTKVGTFGIFTVTITNGVITLVNWTDAGADAVVLNAANVFTPAGSITLNKVNGTEASNAVTASGTSGLITTSALTTAGAGSYVITWTNTAITATSVVLLTLAGGTNTTENITLKVVPGAGTATLTIYNNTAATALNGTILISYLVM